MTTPSWIKAKDRLPEPGRTVLCRIQHCTTKRELEYRLDRVEESDCDWRIANDGGELSFDWTVTEWKNE